MDYRKDTAYVVGGGKPIPSTQDMYGNPVYEPQVFTQAQLNNNMSGTDANAIYQATHDQSFAPEYNQPYMQNYLADLARMGLANYNGQQTPDTSGSYVTGAGAFMMPSSIGTEQVLPRGMGSWEGLESNAQNWGAPVGRLNGGDAARAQYYGDVLNALLQSGGTFPSNANAIQKERILTAQGVM